MFESVFEHYLRYWSTFSPESECAEFTASPESQFYSRQFLSAVDTAINGFFSLYGYGDDTALPPVTPEQLAGGMTNLINDIKKSATMLNIQLTPETAYRVGHDLACTPGFIVFSNELFELIQYDASTQDVRATPVLFIPSIINKYYILDLNDEKSMVKWLRDNHYSVFIISWKNPENDVSDISLSDYVVHGVIKAIATVCDITKKKSIHTAGYCLGGTLLALAAGYYKAKKLTSKIRTTSFFATLLDFSLPGDLGFFIKNITSQMAMALRDNCSVIDGRDLNVLFNLLREKNLYWNYYLSKYIYGEQPQPSEFLFWSGDGMNMPVSFCRSIVNDFYLGNNFVSKRGVEINGVFVDISQVSHPGYFVGTKGDHITLWEGCFRGAGRIKNDCHFVLGQSGHVAGIINPPHQQKYGFWHGPVVDSDSAGWLERAEYSRGSWWAHWSDWLSQHESGKRQRHSGAVLRKQYPPLLAAPGSYVLKACEHQ
ncbi:alpha/beta fold hydrolase [Klebsiella aerogenes]|uniref:alpha/beta fold hydrolase n=1 Tax=Klebsiella aerogenes TaxID=548 RepID=UPI001F1E2AAB|nr:alpha/beta fold hydrolase [Klebsiella aerogenes]